MPLATIAALLQFDGAPGAEMLTEWWSMTERETEERRALVTYLRGRFQADSRIARSR
ncbi:MAG: hypothetical protein ACRDVP_12335 [Acidimicrobiales bacterium]